MKAIEAHELLAADRGVEIVLTTGAFTYVGWFLQAKDLGNAEGRRWTGVRLDEADGRKVTAIVPSTSSVQITPFPPLALGDTVRRAGRADAATGTVVGVDRSQEGDRVYRVQWPDQSSLSWHTRRRLERVGIPNEEVDR